MAYEINWTNVTTAEQMLALANTGTGSWFWTATLYLLWSVLTLSMFSFGIVPAILSASFACFMIGLLMTYMGLVSWVWTASFMGMIIVLFFVKILSSSD